MNPVRHNARVHLISHFGMGPRRTTSPAIKRYIVAAAGRIQCPRTGRATVRNVKKRRIGIPIAATNRSGQALRRHWKIAINPVTHAHRATNGVITSAWRRAKTSRFLRSGGFVFWIRSTPWYSNELHSFRAFHTIVGEKRTRARRAAR